MAWITAEDLRGAAGAKQAIDQDKFEDAAEFACSKVEELCGPIAWATITDERVRISGSTQACLMARVTRGLTAVADYRTGNVLPLADWDADGQVLERKDGGPVPTDLLVSYQTGYFDDTVEDAKAPAWARIMAKLIGHQYIRVSRRFQIAGGEEDLSQTHFVMPNAALDAGHDYLLIRGRVG